MKFRLLIRSLTVLLFLFFCISIRAQIELDPGNSMHLKILDKENQNFTSDVKNHMGKLSQMNPISDGGINAKMPGFVGNFKLKKTHEVPNIPNYNDQVYEYEEIEENPESLLVHIIDGAGGGAASYAGIGFNILPPVFYFKSTDLAKHSKFYQWKGTHVVQQYHAQSDEYNLLFIIAERFIFTIKSSTLGPDKLWSFLNSFPIEKFEKGLVMEVD